MLCVCSLALCSAMITVFTSTTPTVTNYSSAKTLWLGLSHGYQVFKTAVLAFLSKSNSIF